MKAGFIHKAAFMTSPRFLHQERKKRSFDELWALLAENSKFIN